MSKHTPGPWHEDNYGRIWRRPPSDLYENGGSVAGDKPLAFVNPGWHGENETCYPIAANARLIAAAPELLEALQEMIDDARNDRVTVEVFNQAVKVAAKATGERP